MSGFLEHIHVLPLFIEVLGNNELTMKWTVGGIEVRVCPPLPLFSSYCRHTFFSFLGSS
jgi:hypothetical protein